MGAHYAATNGQSKPCAGVEFISVAEGMEHVEDVFPIHQRNTRAVVMDIDMDARIIALGGPA